MISGFSSLSLITTEEWVKRDKAYDAILNGLEINPADMWPGMQQICGVLGSTLVIHVQGFVTRVVDPILKCMGATSTEEIIKFIVQGIKQKGIEKIVLKIHSPGGDPSAVIVAEFVYKLRNLIPIYCLCDTEALSAAYWIASACKKIYIACETTKLGSIGCIVSGRREKEDNGLIVARKGKFKASSITSATFLSDEEIQKIIEDRITHIYNCFVQDVSRFRGLSSVDIETMEGLTYIGSNAIRAGLCDGFYDLSAWNISGEVKEREEGEGLRLRVDFLNSVDKGEK